MNFVIPGSAALWMPERLAPSTWLGHIPFAFWLVTTHRPRVVVELGTHNGSSYMAFCQAIEKSGFAASAYAIDTWRGDEQTGFYGEDVFADVTAYHDRRYLAFSRLVRSTFDQALDHFADGSIELLHIDGFHAYGAVKHDFDAWRPKLSERAIVLMHDINVRERGFGVWRLWEELIADHPHFAFQHHHGLGVLGIGSEPPPALRSLIEASANESDAVELRACFARLGNGIQAQFDAQRLLSVQDRMAGEARAERAALASTGAERDRAAYQSRRALRLISPNSGPSRQISGPARRNSGPSRRSSGGDCPAWEAGHRRASRARKQPRCASCSATQTRRKHRRSRSRTSKSQRDQPCPAQGEAASRKAVGLDQLASNAATAFDRGSRRTAIPQGASEGRVGARRQPQPAAAAAGLFPGAAEAGRARAFRSHALADEDTRRKNEGMLPDSYILYRILGQRSQPTLRICGKLTMISS